MKSWKKRLCALMLGAMILSVMCVSAFAAGSSGGSTPQIDTAAINAAFVTGFNGMVVNSISMLSAMVPIALTLAGVLFVARKCMGWFKAIGK